MPDNFCTASNGTLYISNGIDPVMKWDGLSGDLETSGVAKPTTAMTLAASGTGTITGTYYGYSRFVDADGNFSDLSPISAAVVAATDLTITYTNVPKPTQAKVRRRQIIRNTAGQTGTFYVDVDTQNLTATTFSSTKTDTQLQAQTSVPLFDSEGLPLANLHGVAPSWKTCLASSIDRLFLAGEEPYTEGAIAITSGSKTVTGAGTYWPANFSGRFLWVPGADKPYEIDSVDESAQTLTLLQSYAGATARYTEYSIRAPSAERRLLYFSEAGSPEAWPPTNAITVQEDGDEIVGLIPLESFLYIVCRRHMYKLSFQDGPNDDGFIFLSVGRGCANNRCWVVADEQAYLLDAAGIYRFSSGEVEELSAPVQDLFEPTLKDLPFRLRWEASRWWHACHDPGRGAIRWFVTMSGSGLPRHALCLDLDRGAFWIEEYPFPVGASCVGLFKGERRVFLGGPAGQVYLLGENSLDLVDSSAGTSRGRVTGSAPCTLSDAYAEFADSIVGAPVVIVSGRGVGQRRKVVAVTTTTLALDVPWLVQPDESSVYQVGGIQYRYRTGWFRWLSGEDQQPRSLEVQFEPHDSECLLDLAVYQDRKTTPEVWDSTRQGREAGGFDSRRGTARMTADMASGEPFARRNFDGRKERRLDGPRLVSFELSGVTAVEQVRLYHLSVEGVQQPTRGEE